MKVLDRGALNYAYVCKAKCAWCGSKLKFYRGRGDKRVTSDPQHNNRFKFICSVCGERNSNVIGYCKTSIPIEVEYRKLTRYEYEDEIMSLEDEVVEMSDDDKEWLAENNYIHQES